jgi:hypothetical protein
MAASKGDRHDGSAGWITATDRVGCADASQPNYRTADVRTANPRQGPVSGCPVRTETTTSWIALVTAAA